MFEPDASAAGSTASQESLWPESTYEWMTERTSNNVVLRARESLEHPRNKSMLKSQ